MRGKRFTKANKRQGLKAQAIVEFAIALPVLLALIIGIFEVARFLFIYSAVTNASRSAARYASAVGLEDTGTYHKYMYCDGIKNVAIKSAYLMNPSNLSISIAYDGGPGTSPIVVGGCNFSGGDDMDVFNAHISTGDRVTVTVVARYSPMLKLIPISPRDINSSSSRTILGVVDLQP